MPSISPHGPVKVAVTVDDRFMWRRSFPPSHSAESVTTSLLQAFSDSGVPEVVQLCLHISDRRQSGMARYARPVG